MTEYNVNSQFTLLERAKGTINGREMLPLLDVMDKRGVSSFLQDVPYFPCNMGILHKFRRTTSMPASSRRAAYEGATITELTTQELTESLLHFEQWSSIDEQEALGLSNFNEERARRDKIKIAALLSDFVNAIFNDARTSGPKYLNGLAQRMKTLSYPGHTTTSLPYVWDNGGTAGTGYLTSAYIIEWGQEATHGLYPSDNAGVAGALGVNAVNLGLQTVTTAVSPLAVYRAFQSQFTKDGGICVNDDRKVTRIANIETRTAQTTGRFNEDVIIRALRHGRMNPDTSRIYVNPFLAADVDIRAKNLLNGWNVRQVFGEDVTTFMNIPVRVLDDTIITSTETAIA